MASKAVNEILQTEEQAREAVEAAQKMAQKTIEDAYAEGNSIQAQACADARAKADALLQGARAKAQTMRGQKAGEAKGQVETLREQVQEKQKRAVDRVISLIIPSANV